ncbi:MAG: copper-binding protein [Candidatus Competibacter sp.]|nr:copper-binding protein [Candidatus Competibacter sp.]
MKSSLWIPVGLAALLGSGTALAADTGHAQHAAPATVTGKSIPATGIVKSVDAAAGKAVIDHDPIDALKWPRMTMDFRLADKALANKVKAGDKVKFELQAADKGSYTVTAIEAAR